MKIIKPVDLTEIRTDLFYNMAFNHHQDSEWYHEKQQQQTSWQLLLQRKTIHLCLLAHQKLPKYDYIFSFVVNGLDFLAKTSMEAT